MSLKSIYGFLVILFFFSLLAALPVSQMGCDDTGVNADSTATDTPVDNNDPDQSCEIYFPNYTKTGFPLMKGPLLSNTWVWNHSGVFQPESEKTATGSKGRYYLRYVSQSGQSTFKFYQTWWPNKCTGQLYEGPVYEVRFGEKYQNLENDLETFVSTCKGLLQGIFGVDASLVGENTMQQIENFIKAKAVLTDEEQSSVDLYLYFELREGGYCGHKVGYSGLSIHCYCEKEDYSNVYVGPWEGQQFIIVIIWPDDEINRKAAMLLRT
jgi:hypothetical protein